MKKLALTLMFAVGVAFAFGCTTVVKQEVVSPQAPEWVMKGTGVFSGDKGKVFRGIGVVQHVNNIGLARDAASADARKELANVFNNYIASMTKIYRRSTVGGDPAASSEEQDITQATKSFTKMQLSGVTIAEFYHDPTTNTWYALAEMDLDLFKDFNAKAQEMSEKARDFIRENADKAFEELAAEESK